MSSVISGSGHKPDLESGLMMSIHRGEPLQKGDQ
jgi:hypothetical protein